MINQEILRLIKCCSRESLECFTSWHMWCIRHYYNEIKRA